MYSARNFQRRLNHWWRKFWFRWCIPIHFFKSWSRLLFSGGWFWVEKAFQWTWDNNSMPWSTFARGKPVKPWFQRLSTVQCMLTSPVSDGLCFQSWNLLWSLALLCLEILQSEAVDEKLDVDDHVEDCSPSSPTPDITEASGIFSWYQLLDIVLSLGVFFFFSFSFLTYCGFLHDYSYFKWPHTNQLFQLLRIGTRFSVMT